MNDQHPEHPLGTPHDDPAPDTTPSIVDTILDLDELLSADVRLAEKTARFATEAWREARIDELNDELDSLTDAAGNSLVDAEASVGGGRTAQTVALELREEQRLYAASFRGVRMRQLNADDWDAFETKWRTALDEGAPYPKTFWSELITASAVRPKITADQLEQLRTRVGRPAVDELGVTAWHVNTKSGVSVPKSQLSSLVLKRMEREKS